MGSPVNVLIEDSTVKVTGTFRDVNGQLANPTNTTFKYVLPSGGNPVVVGPSSSATGIWTVQFEVTEFGKYCYEWEGTGAVDVVMRDQFYVSPRLT